MSMALAARTLQYEFPEPVNQPVVSKPELAYAVLVDLYDQSSELVEHITASMNLLLDTHRYGIQVLSKFLNRAVALREEISKAMDECPR